MKDFKDIGAFVKHLQTLRAKVAVAEHSGLERGAKMIEKEAKDSIGHYQNASGPFPAWTPLSSATLEGFHHPLAGYIPGKEQLGYAPPDNPLLREGGLRESYTHHVDGHEAVVGSNEENAVWQEMGTPNALYPIPPRSILGGAAVRKAEAVVKEVAEHVLVALSGIRKNSGNDE